MNNLETPRQLTPEEIEREYAEKSADQIISLSKEAMSSGLDQKDAERLASLVRLKLAGQTLAPKEEEDLERLSRIIDKKEK